MCAAKKKRKHSDAPAQRNRWRIALAAIHPRIFMLVAVAVAFITLGMLGWAKWGPSITSRPRYALTPSNLQVTPKPAWIHVDVTAEVLRDGSLTDLSILDPELTKRVAHAFELHTWVDRVVRVLKRPGPQGARVVVELLYREPVVMVKTTDGFWPVDGRGVLLPPNEFSPSQTRNFLRVLTGNPRPAGPVGTPFGDAGVVGAAYVANMLRTSWRAEGLQWIVVQRDDNRQADAKVTPTFLLLPEGIPPGDMVATDLMRRQVSEPNSEESNPPVLPQKPIVRWGHAPGREAIGEALAPEKVSRLAQFVQQYGPLDQMHQPLIIDLRPGTGIGLIRPDRDLKPASY